MPGWQSAPVAHAARHAPLDVSHTYVPHDAPLADSAHAFGPAHDRGRLSFPTHDADPHVVPTAQYAHARCPSHVPVVPHVDAPCAAHSSSGSCPDTIGPHTPSAPAPFFPALHASHAPAHAVSQHTPSTQLPFAHSAPAVHALPPVSSGMHRDDGSQ